MLYSHANGALSSVLAADLMYNTNAHDLFIASLVDDLLI